MTCYDLLFPRPNNPFPPLKCIEKSQNIIVDCDTTDVSHTDPETKIKTPKTPKQVYASLESLDFSSSGNEEILWAPLF